MTGVLPYPLLVPLAGGVAALLVTGHPRRAHRLALLTAGLHAAVSGLLFYAVVTRGIQATPVGSWPAPFGIILVADRLSAVLVLITAVVNLAVTAYSANDVPATLVARGYYALLQILSGAICGAFVTGDLFNLYVWFEVMLITSFGLLVMEQRAAQLDGGVSYVVINLLATLLILTGIGLLYGLTGTLNLADLHRAVPLVADRGLVTAVAMLLLAAFGIKAAFFPLYFWLPAAYHTPPVAVSAMFAGLLTKVGVYAVIRVWTLVFFPAGGCFDTVLLVAAALTMISGVLGAAAQGELRRILAFHIISQVGYMVMGLGLNTRLALAGTIFYLIHHIVVKANLFLVSGLVHRVRGSFDLARLGGIYRSHGWLALVFFIPAFSLAGFPPLSGFWAKLFLIQAGLDARAYPMVAVAVVVGLLTAYSMTKMWGEAFWKPLPGSAGAMARPPAAAAPAGMVVPVVLLALLTVVIGLGAEAGLDFAQRAAGELVDPQGYIDAVMGARP